MSTWTNINEWESGGSARAKINDAMAYLFGSIGGLWEIDGNAVKPIDGRSVEAAVAAFGELTATEIIAEEIETNELTAGGGNVMVKNDGGLYIDDQKSTVFGSRPLRIDTQGKVFAEGVAVEEGGVIMGNDAVITNDSAYTTDLDNPVVVVITDGLCDIALQDAPARRRAEFLIRKAQGSGVVAINANAIVFDEGEGGVLQLGSTGSWARIKAITDRTVSPAVAKWWVISHGGDVVIDT